MVIKLDGLSEKEKKAHLRFAFLYPKSFALIKQEGRVEGAKTELEKIIKFGIRNEWKKEAYEIYVKKRLKELEMK